MERNEIICPHCKQVNEPGDDENCNIEFAPMECEHCEKDFYLSREITIEYETFTPAFFGEEEETG